MGDLEEDFHNTHCLGCINFKKCSTNPDNIAKCELIQCHMKCGAIFHACKEQEHKLLCLNEKVPCYNKDGGCPCLMQRGLLASHLTKCPASVIHCTMEWNRRHINEVTEKQLELCKQSVEQRNQQPQLDIALALRDQRLLRQWYTSGKLPQKALRYHSKKPQRNMLITKQSEDLCEASQDTEVSDLCSNVWYNKLCQAYEWMDNYNTKLLRRSDGILLNKLSSSDQSEENKENMINNVRNTHCADTKSEILDHTSRYSDCSDSRDCQDQINVEKVLRIKDDVDDTFKFDEFMADAVVPHPTRYLGLNPNLEIAGQSFMKEMYTFLCCQEFRRDEYSSHYKNVHCEIHGGLNGWLQERCPLAQYGCTFSRQRLNPKPKGSKLVYNEVLESFGVMPPSPECLNRPISPIDENMYSSDILYEDRVKIISITQLPYELLRYIAGFLDSFSLSNLSLTCSLMRDVCQTLLIEKGIVTLQWDRKKKGDSYSWEVSKKKWCFSSHFSPVHDWRFEDSNNMSDHLKNCAFFNRNVNLEPFHHIKGYITPEGSLYQKLSRSLENVITKL